MTTKIPPPREGESQDAYVDRAMNDPVVRKAHPDRKERAAACYRAWRSYHMNARASAVAREAERSEVGRVMVLLNSNYEVAAAAVRIERAAAHVRRVVPPEVVDAVARKPAPPPDVEKLQDIFRRARAAGWIEPECRPVHMMSADALARHRAAGDQVVRELRDAGLGHLLDEAARTVRTPVAAPLTVAALCKLARVPFEPYAAMSIEEARSAITRARAVEDESLVIVGRHGVAGEMAGGVDADAARAALDRGVEIANR